MIKYFKLSNIILIVLFLAIVYFAYLSFFKKDLSEINIFNDKETEGIITQTSKSKGDISSEGKAQKDSSGKKENNNTSLDSETERVVTPTPKVLQDIASNKIVEKDEEEKENGFYRNSTYNYQVIFPRDWPLRIRSKENISLGYVIPENGLGAVTIEVSEEENDEIETLEQEIKKYPGMIEMSEETVFIDGFKGVKYTLTENISGDEDVFILIEKDEYYLLIKYPTKLENLNSSKFLIEVESILSNFKFND